MMHGFNRTDSGRGGLAPHRAGAPARHLASSRQNPRAFTLIELLVVIAIIAILAAILFPVFAKARKQANKSVCANNIKELNTAFRMYVDDNDGIFPVHWDNLRRGQFGDIDVDVANIIAPYIKQGVTKTAGGLQMGTGVWLCPEDRVGGGPLGPSRQAAKQERRTSYWYNPWLSNVGLTTIKKDFTRCILVQDSWIDTHTSPSDNPRAWNVGYVDGHTRWVNYPEPWNTDLQQYSGYNADSSKWAIKTKTDKIYDPKNL